MADNPKGKGESRRKQEAEPPDDSGGEYEAPRGARPEAEDEQFEEDAATQYVAPAEGQPPEPVEARVEAEAAGFWISEDLRAVKAAIETQLLTMTADGGTKAQSYEGAGNIQGVGFGVAEEGQMASGAAPGDPVLNVYVAEPQGAEEVRAVIAEAMGVTAAASEDVPINVVVSGAIDAQPHRFRIRPAPGGVSVGHFRVTAGTLGCLATGLHAPRTNRLFILSNNHVLANSNAAAFGDCISQPGRADGGVCPADRIAILERFIPITFAGACNYVDCATGWAWPNLVRRELMYVSGGVRRFFRVSSAPRACAVGLLVGKTGRTTQLTTGRITDCSASVRVNYGLGRVALFCDQIVIRSVTTNPFSAGGDSGSLVWTWDARRNPVGLLFAGGGGLTIANKIGRVLAALDIRLVT
jgi:hypothetical protein